MTTKLRWLVPLSLAAGGGSLLAMIPLVWIRHPATLRFPEDLPDPLAREPLGRGGCIALVAVMGGFGALGLLAHFHGEMLASPVRNELPWYLHEAPRWLPGLAGLVLPFFAYIWFWRPRPWATAGMAVTAAGSLTAAAGGLLGAQVAMVGWVAALLGRGELFDMAALPLLRQSVPVSRVALAYAGYGAAWLLGRVLVFLPAHWITSSPVLLLAAGLLIAPLVWLLLRVTREGGLTAASGPGSSS